MKDPRLGRRTGLGGANAASALADPTSACLPAEEQGIWLFRGPVKRIYGPFKGGLGLM